MIIKHFDIKDILFNNLKFIPHKSILASNILKIKSHLLKHKKFITTNDNLLIFTAVKHVNWGKPALVDSWKNFGTVIHYDWRKKYNQYDKDWHRIGKFSFNKELLKKVKEIHKNTPIHIFFSYLSGRLVFPKTIEEINHLGIITINIGFDDTSTFWGIKEPTGYSGNAEIAPYYDISITCQNPKDIYKYLHVGGRPIFIPPAANPDIFAKLEAPTNKSIQVCFIGQNYGKRTKIINYLISEKIPIIIKGKGWPDGPVTINDMLKVYNNSLLALGFGYIKNTKITGLKARDFEVPMTGTAYITTFNKILQNYFIPDKEILFYKNEKDLLNKIKYYLENPKLAISIGINGKKRALQEHTWSKRWESLLEIIGK